MAILIGEAPETRGKVKENSKYETYSSIIYSSYNVDEAG
jgi:hypothetical protein